MRFESTGATQHDSENDAPRMNRALNNDSPTASTIPLFVSTSLATLATPQHLGDSVQAM